MPVITRPLWKVSLGLLIVNQSASASQGTVYKVTHMMLCSKVCKWAFPDLPKWKLYVGKQLRNASVRSIMLCKVLGGIGRNWHHQAGIWELWGLLLAPALMCSVTVHLYKVVLPLLIMTLLQQTLVKLLCALFLSRPGPWFLCPLWPALPSFNKNPAKSV